MMKAITLAIVAFFTSCPVFAQNENLFSQFRIEHWDTKNGLPNDLILSLHQDKDGFLWMTSYNGLTRFDGVNFTSFNSRNVAEMKTDKAIRITETKDSTLWIPTESSGLLAYKKGVFTSHLKNFYGLRILAQTKNDELLIFSENENNRYMLFNVISKNYKTTSDTLLRQLLKDGKFIFKNRMDHEGNQWRLGEGKLVKYQQGSMLEVPLLPDIRYYEIYVDKKDRVWLTSSKGLFIWNGSSMIPYSGMQYSFESIGDVQDGKIMEDHKGGLWVSTIAGVAYLKSEAAQFVFLPKNTFLKTQNITNILEDREGNIWIASETGLLKLSYSKFKNYSVEEGLNNNRVSAITIIDTGRFMVSSRSKLFWIENGVLYPYLGKNIELNDLRNEFIYLYKDHKQNIWACGTKTFKISPNGMKLIKAPGQVRFAIEDEHEKLWFAMAFPGGIGFLNEKEEIELLNFPKVDFKTLFISSIRKMANGNWAVTTFNKGILLIDKSGNPSFFSDLPGLPTINVFKCYEDDEGTLWLTTNMGISRYKNGVFANISFKDGLPENSLFDFVPDRKGYVWFPSNRGLIRAKKQELADYLDRKINKINWQLYDEGDGMRNRQCVGSRHSAITPDGKILVPTLGGLVVIDPDKLTTNTVPPNVIIHRVLRNDSTINLRENNFFEPGNHRYIFEYSGLSMVAPEKVQFKFKLIGYDKDWISAVGERKAFYTNLPSGNYTFQVIASNNDGVWNETGASFPFTIKPFFYETWWFRTLAVIALLFLIWLAIRYKTRASRKQNELLEKQVQKRTNELSESFKNLQSTQTQLIQSEKMASLGELTAGIAHEIQNPLNFVNNFSEVNTELIEELKEELATGNTPEAILIADGIKENEQKINYHGKRADSIVKGMLQHSRASSGKKEPTDINALADEYLRLSYHGLRAKDKSFSALIKTDFDTSLEQIHIVPQDIGRVILNLLTNAFYAVNERKNASTGLAGQPYEPTVSVSTKKIGDTVEIRVSDNGNGIPQKALDKIFQPFFTTKPSGQGTGLGLSLSYDIVKAHGGELKVETLPAGEAGKESEGSTFIIHLPASI